MLEVDKYFGKKEKKRAVWEVFFVCLFVCWCQRREEQTSVLEWSDYWVTMWRKLATQHLREEHSRQREWLAQRLKAETVLACLGNSRGHCGQSRISEGENSERAAEGSSEAWIMYGLSVSEMGVIADQRDDMKWLTF